ncbi:hypothetical protein SAMN05443575_1807 [Jatrophihabitans endophyticus]|uniref:Uncharacterized protein n=1 Tax=Jatrophihabitans endophyticus TaxID=1206085 RepID=A0A1M5I987_9ACTN|nr:hypothetical protein [Jatrophihabitans endophyticus]SHG24856.1 hypothetical protein SAMN05443575_1807 [Jatrophihabitans endophyticus]
MGRHSAPDDDVASDVLTRPADDTPRPHPGRHSRPGADDTAADATDDTAEARDELQARPEDHPGDDSDDDGGPHTGGLDLIEDALSRGRPRPARDSDGQADGHADEPVASDETVQIAAIADPVLDRRVPEAETAQLRAVTDASPPQATGGATAAQTPAQGAEHTEHTGHADAPPQVSDVALLRGDSALRARVAAAVVAPFVLYVLVLIVLDEFEPRTALIWIWLPLVTAGVVAGLLLDLAHRRAVARVPEVDRSDG